MNKSMYRCFAILMAGIFSVSFANADDVDLSKYIGGDYSSALQAPDSPPSSSPVTSSSAGDDPTQARKDVEDDGYTAQALAFKGKAEAVVAAAKAVSMYVDQGALKNFDQAATYYNRFHGTCVKTQATASGLCREKTSPQLQTALNQINMISSAVSGAVVNDACNAFAKAMQVGQAGLTAYTAACSTARAACESACTTVYNNLERLAKMDFTAQLNCKPAGFIGATSAGCTALQSAVTAAENDFTSNIAKDRQLGDHKSIALKNKACTYEYTSMIASAGMGLASVLNSLKQGQKCGDDSSGSGQQAAAQTLEQKCAIAANAQMPDCICFKNPMLEGCSSTAVKSTQSAGNISAVNAGVGDGKANGSGLTGADLSTGNDGLGGNTSGKNTASAGAPAPTGGGGGAGLGGGGGGSGSGRDPADEKSGQKALNANILSGAGGGGGSGGGGWGSGGGGDSGKGYRSYLPGGDKDPNKMAGQQSWTKEVTGQGGKSNWEKVKDRYRDNKNTLLSN